MSVIRAYPFIEQIIAGLTETQIEDLYGLLNGEGELIEVNIKDKEALDQLKASDDYTGISFVDLEYLPERKAKGFLIYTDTNFVLLSYMGKTQCFKITRFVDDIPYPIREPLSVEELRRAIDDYLEAGGEGGEITPSKLASLMIGDNLISVDLTENSQKVVTAIDMTDAESNAVSVIATSDAENATWATLNSLLNVDDSSLGKFLHLGSSGLNWSTPTVDYSTVETIRVSFTNVGGVYTSDDNLTRNIHLFAELSMSGTHAHIGMDMNVYDSNVSYSVARVRWGNETVDVTGYINSDGAIVLDLSALTGLTDVEARYFYYA